MPDVLAQGDGALRRPTAGQYRLPRRPAAPAKLPDTGCRPAIAGGSSGYAAGVSAIRSEPLRSSLVSRRGSLAAERRDEAGRIVQPNEIVRCGRPAFPLPRWVV